MLGDVENLLNSAVMKYVDKIKGHHEKMLNTLKKLPASAEIIEENIRTEQEDSVKEYVKAYYGVQPQDEKAMRKHIFEKYYNQYEQRNKSYSDELKKRRAVALVNLQEQMDGIRKSMEESGPIHVPDPWRLEDVYDQCVQLNPTLTSEILDFPMPSYVKVLQSDGTMSIQLMNR